MCGGTGIGLYTFAAVATVLGAPPLPLVPLAILLVAIGLFLVLLKIGRPLRFAYVLRQPQRSWMAREAWLALIFFPLAALAFWFDWRPALVAAAVAGLLFLFSQAMMLKEAKGIPAWREPLIVPLIITTGLAEGGGLFVAVDGAAGAALGFANRCAGGRGSCRCSRIRVARLSRCATREGRADAHAANPR